MAGRDLLATEQPSDKPAGRNLFADAPSQEPTPQQELAQETGHWKAGFIAGGRGLHKLGEAFGLADPESPAVTKAYEALNKDKPISTGFGEGVGEALPFLPAGLATGAIKAVVPRVVTSIGLGLTEGGAIAKSRDQDVLQGAGIGGAIAGGLEAAFPIIGRLGAALVKRATGKAATGALLDATGKPTKELADALEASGISFDDLTNKAVQTLKATEKGADPEQAAKLARLESLGAPATTGDITGDFAQQAREARLVESASDKLGDPLRKLRLEQSQAFESQLTSQIEKLGVADDVGESIKSALSGEKKLLTAEKNALYKQVAESSPDVKNAPVLTSSIADAIPSDDALSDLAITAGEGAIEKVDDLLVKFGINRNADDVERFTSKTFRGKPANIEPLNVGNLDRFRKSLNAIDDPTGALSVYTQPIKNALDAEANLIDDALRAAGITDKAIMEPLKRARATVRQIKTEFSPESIAGRLIKVKRDGANPLVESSKVFNELMGANKAPELLERTIESLARSPKGKRAIGDLQARTMVDLLESAFKAKSRKVGDNLLFGARAFNKRLEQIGDRRLQALFANKPDVLKKIRLIGETAESITPPSAAVPKGSASVLLDIADRAGITKIMSTTPTGAATIGFFKDMVESGANRQAVEAAMRGKPQVKQMATFIANEAPSLAAPLGISFLAAEEQ